MEPLIVVSKTEIAGSLAQTVNERNSHQFLGVGKDYSTWIKDQIDRARLVENRDYVVPEKGDRENQGLSSGWKVEREYSQHNAPARAGEDKFAKAICPRRIGHARAGGQEYATGFLSSLSQASATCFQSSNLPSR